MNIIRFCGFGGLLLLTSVLLRFVAPGWPLVQLIWVLGSLLFACGFLFLAVKKKLIILKIAAISDISFVILYEISSIFFDITSLLTLIFIVFGVTSILYGIGTHKLGNEMGIVAYGFSAVMVVVGFFSISVFFYFIGQYISYLSVILGTMLLFKAK